jgi:crossover junction endodeoxyribonuclease RusA
MSTTFTVFGIPQAQGSMRAFMAGGKARMRHSSSKIVPWRQEIAQTALALGVTPIEGAVGIDVVFSLPRPKSVSIKKRPLPTTKPDLDKLVRAVLDALIGIAYVDDAQVAQVAASKVYGEPKAVITITDAVEV